MSSHIKLSMSIRTILVILICGFVLSCTSIVIGKKSTYPECNFTEHKLNMVDRGFPLTYFRVTPSDSDCAPVDDIGAVIRSDVGNDIRPASFIADTAIWSATAAVIFIAISVIARQTKLR